jgi:tetratricopeptide (TPR) repeat protein
VLAGVAALAGLLAKEVAIAALLAILAGTVVGSRGTSRERARTVARRLPYLVVPAVAYAVLRWTATRGVSSRISSLGAAPRARTTLESVGRYVEMILDPYHPTTTIGFAREIDTATMVLGGAVLAGCVVAVMRALVRFRRAPLLRAPVAGSGIAVVIGGTLALGSLALVIHVVPIVVISAVAADRLLYLPLAGIALALAVSAGRLGPTRLRLAGAAAIVLGATFIPVTRARARDYTDDLRFRVAAAEHAHPHNTTAKRALGLVLLAKGEVDLACRLQESVSRTLTAMGPAARPQYLHAAETLGSCYAVLGDYDNAARLFAEVAAAHPDAAIHSKIGFLALQTFAFDEAETSLRRALELDASLEPPRDALEKLPLLRSEAARLQHDPEARRADPLAWARLLTDLGRVRDATQPGHACMLDPSMPDDAMSVATTIVIPNSDIPTGLRVAQIYVARNPGNVWVAARAAELVRARARDGASVDAVRARLEALAAR